MADNKKIAVNGNTSGYNPTFQDNVTMALIQNGAVKRIQESLQQRLDECGWSQNLRQYVEKLFRSGEAVTYDDALKIVSKMIELKEPGEDNNKSTINGSGVPDLTIPEAAAIDAAEVVKKEMRGVLKMEK